MTKGGEYGYILNFYGKMELIFCPHQKKHYFWDKYFSMKWSYTLSEVSETARKIIEVVPRKLLLLNGEMEQP
ncbi:MAG: hypothetical protein CSA94_02620 [Bacteroidetes bacterium]|nr:MAG: hypothetical protein CSA94_02620 [Bacteroidota bacterium]